MYCPSYADLLLFDASNYIFNGFFVTVWDADASKRGVYVCINENDLSNPASWQKLGTGGASINETPVALNIVAGHNYTSDWDIANDRNAIFNLNAPPTGLGVHIKTSSVPAAGQTGFIIITNNDSDNKFSFTAASLYASDYEGTATFFSIPADGRVHRIDYVFDGTNFLLVKNVFPAAGEDEAAWLKAIHALETSMNTIYATAVLVDGANIVFDATLLRGAYVVLGGNRTLSFNGFDEGMNLTLVVAQDATGGRTLTLPACKVVTGGNGGVTLTPAPNAEDILTFYKVNGTIYCNYGKNYN